MEQTRLDRTLWPFFAASAVVAILVAAIFWSLAHPYGIHWDEAQYFNEIQIDVQRLREGMLLRLVGRLLLRNWGRPPAYRILALPFLGAMGFHTTAARAVSLAWFCLSSLFIYLAASRIASRVAGAFAVLIFCLSPEVISASIFFGTDTPLYLAVSAMLYYIFAIWSDRTEPSKHWIGLGLAIGLGFLSKTSFFAIVIPVLVYWFALGLWGGWGVPKLTSQWRAGLLALLMAGPWWLLNIRSAFAYGQYSRAFVRNSLGPPSPATFVRWFDTVFQSLLGHGLSILIFLVLVAWFVMAVVRKRVTLDRLQLAGIGVCASAGVPIVLAQLSGTNHLLRHITPAVIPLAVAVGLLADKTGWAYSTGGTAISAALFCAQFVMLVSPVIVPNAHPLEIGFVNGSLPWRTMIRFDQWDWRLVQAISDSCGLENPSISYLGAGRVFNPPAIEYPWIARVPTKRLDHLDIPDVTWLWRYEDGPLNWQEVMNSAEKSDIVITAPHYVGEVLLKEDLDNQHNAEFENRLSKDALFQGPIELRMGRFEPVEVVVFLKKTLVCRSEQGTSAALQKWSTNASN